MLAVVALVAAAFVIGIPILDGGYRTYLDNGPHLAELYAGGSGWSQIAFAGLSLDTLHSPIFWRALGHAGPLLEPAYAGLVCLAVAAPALAVYRVARRRTAPLPALVLAYIVLVQRSTLVGSASATGGMWTFYLAAAAWILLADELARADRRIPAIAALLGFIGLTHLYVLQAAVILALVHAGWQLVARRARTLRGDALACLLAAAAAAAYWVPMALVHGLGFDEPQNLPIGDLARLLVTPTDTIHILAGSPLATLPLGIEAVPMIALLAAGAVGAVYAIRNRRDDALPIYGMAVALVVAAALALAPSLELRMLGPNSWRFLYFIRLGAALAAIPLVARLPSAARLVPVVAVVAVASGWLWGAPLRDEVPPAAAMADVRALWSWLGANARGERVYLQDTFYVPPINSPLLNSHVLALTLHESGAEPLGPYYGILPSATAAETRSELGAIFGRPVMPRAFKSIALPTAAWGVTKVVTGNNAMAALLSRSGYPRVAAFGRFTVFATPAEPLAPRGTRDGNTLAFDLTGPTITAVAYHPFWRVREGDAQLLADPKGRIALVGAGHIVIEYAPPTVWPASVAGWLGILALWLRKRRHAR